MATAAIGTAPQPSAPRRRVTYIIPPASSHLPPPRLQLPPEGVPRHGAPRPILIRTPSDNAAQQTSPTSPFARSSVSVSSFFAARRPVAPAQPTHARHRLGVECLALDTATQLVGRTAPGGILYSGGRDGMLCAWDLGLRMNARPYRPPVGLTERPGRRWEVMTGWADDDDDEEEEDTLDGDVLGEVSGARRRRTSRPDDPFPYEKSWEVELDDSEDLPATEFRQAVQAHSDWITAIQLANQNQTVLSASSDGTIKAWSPHTQYATASEPALIGTHGDYVRCLALARERGWLASGSFDRTIKLWDVSRAATSSSVPAQSLSSQLSALLGVGAPGGSHAAPAKEPEPVLTLSPPDSAGPKASIYALACDPAGTILASGSPERVIRLWDARAGKRTAKLVGHTDNIRALVFSSDGRWLLSAGADASIKLWSVAAQRCLHTFTHHAESVWALQSDHPTLEVFYSADRTGLLCRVDVEGCSDVSEGECILLARVGANQEGRETSDDTEVQPSGVNALAVADDRLAWTAAAGSSSAIQRWRVPNRRALRLGQHFLASHELDSPTSYSPTNLQQDRRTSFASFNSQPVTNSSASHTTRGGIPLDSLIHLQSASDSFGIGPLRHAYHGREDVATLYSAASIMSVPRHRTPMSAGFPVTSTGASGEISGLDDDEDALGAYEARELAAEADPLLDAPVDQITGDTGLIRTVLLNDRIHAITVDTLGCVAVWDIIRGTCVGIFPTAVVRKAVAEHLSPDAPASEKCSPREALEAVRARIEGEAVVNAWCTVETRGGLMEVHLNERCFEAEIFADEAGYDEGDGFNDEQRLNIGKWVLRNLFSRFIRQEQRSQRQMHEHYSGNGGTPGPGVVNAGLVGIGAGLQRTGGPSYDDFTTTRAAIMRNTSSSSLSGSGASTPGTPGAAPYSPLMMHSHFVPAVPPSSSNLGDMRRSPTTAFNVLHAHSGLSPIPQSPPTAEDAATPMPIPRRVPQTPTLGEDGLPRGKDDYFSLSRSRQVSGQQPTSPGEESTSSGPSVVPASPTAASMQSPGASLMGKIKLFGRPKRTPSELATPGPVTSTVPEEVATGPTSDQLALHALLSAPLTPPSSTEAPSLALAPHTRIVMSEEAPPGWRTRAVTSVGSANLDMRAIEEWAPRWLLEYLLVNKTPQIGVPKLSFVLIPYEQGKDTLPQLLNAQQSKLTASRFLRVRKLLAHVQDKLDKLASPTHSPSTVIPPSVTPSTRPRATPRTSPRSSFDRHHLPHGRPKAEDLYEMLCHGVVLPLDMTLAAVRQFVWRSSEELELHYRRKSQPTTQ